jgi:DNA-binding CsgD family transcriptional regulator
VNDDLGLSPSLIGGIVRRDSQDWPALWFAQEATARLIVRRDLTLLAANRNALALLETNAVLGLRDGVITARDRKTMAELTAIVAEVEPAAKFGVVGAGGAALLVDAVAIKGEGEVAIAVTLRDLGASVEIACADLEAMFSVTPGEHQVILQLLKGYSSREIAAQFGKSILTVRTHVKRAYGKIGVKTRGQLFARLLPYLSIR